MNRPLLHLAALLSAAPLGAQEAPIEPPDPAPVAAPLLPVAQEALLPNGLRLVVLEQHRQPILSLTLSLPAGSAYEPDGKEGLADMLAALLTRGAGARSGPEVATLIESIGGSFSAAADPDALTIQADVLSSHAALAFGLLADAVLRPTLDVQEITAFRAQAAANLDRALEDPATVAGRIFLTTTYGQHPYGRRAFPRTVSAVGRADLLAFLKSRVRPAGSVFVVAGDITFAEARRLVTASFRGWTGLRPAALPAVPPVPAPAGILLVHAGGVQDANIIVGNTTFGGADIGYYAATVLGRILGDATRGRLGRAFNQEHAWSATAAVAFLRSAGRGLFEVTVTVATNHADSTLAELYSQLSRLRTDTVTERELQHARENVAGGFALRLQTVGQLGRVVTESRQLGLSSNYPSSYRKRIEGVTAVQVRALARRIIPAARPITIVVGDAARLYQPLSRLARVAIFSIEGRPLTLAEIQPRASPLVFDVSTVSGRSDSLLILAQGKAVGLQVTRLTRDADSLIYMEETALGSEISQTTRLTFDTAGHMRQLDQTGRVRGQDTRIRLAYGTGRVRGSATVAGPGGPRTIAIDTTVSATIIDDNALPAILPLLKWDLNTRWTLQVFGSGENLVRTMTLTAADLTRINVPAGEFDCYRADLEGGPQRLSFYVTSTSPHRLVRVELPGSAFEFVAVNP